MAHYLIELPDKAAMDAFVADPDYAPYAASRQAGTDSQLSGIGAMASAGTSPYLI